MQGLPELFPQIGSEGKESEKKVKVTRSCLTLCDLIDCTVHGTPRPEYGSGELFPLLGDLPNPGIEPRSPALQVDSLPAEPQGKPKNTGVGSLSLLQGIFLTQELNRGLLYCRILDYLSYQGSPPEGKIWRKDAWGLVPKEEEYPCLHPGWKEDQNSIYMTLQASTLRNSTEWSSYAVSALEKTSLKNCLGLYLKITFL